MSVALSEHLPLLATAPDGIRKLRGLILELAVRGKLVPRDPKDEPASELLKRIAQERARLEAAGKIRKSKPFPPVDEGEQPYTLPENWSWSRLGQSVIESSAGWSPSCESRPRENDEWGVLKVSSVSWGTFNPAENKALPPNLEPRSEHEVVAGDFLVSRANTADLVARSVVVKDCPRHLMLSDKIVRLKLSKSVNGQFVNLANSCFHARNYYAAVAGGTSASMKNVSRDQILNLAIPLPPLAEQRRIVAKVDDLMALCDRLEAEQADAEAAHAKLLETLLGTLTQSNDAADLAANWQRLAEHFDTLFTTEPALDALKQTILQLAVMGKLVPQDPKGEPASELLRRIARERARLEAEGVCRKSKPMPPVGEDEQPFEVPEGWTWERIGNYVIQTDYGLSEKTFAAIDGVPVLKMGDIQAGNVILGRQKAVPPTTEGLPYLFLEPDDLLYNRTNSAELVGKTGIYRGPAQQYSFASYLIRIRCANGIVSPTFLNFAMNAPMFRDTEIVPHLKQQCGQANVNGTILRNMRIPVPPAAEQYRIVAKVDELMALCDRLKTDLVESSSRQAQLASTLIESALEAA